MEELHFAAYLVQALVEEHAAAGGDERQLRAFYKRLEQSPMVHRLAAAVAAIKRLMGEQTAAHDEYVQYAEELLRVATELKGDRQRADDQARELKRRMLEGVPRTEATVVCESCAHTVARTAKYCPVCGAKMGLGARSATASLVSGDRSRTNTRLGVSGELGESGKLPPLINDTDGGGRDVP
jgi:rubrerythrin